MKRFFILVLSILCVFTLFVGCSGDDSSSKKPSGNQNAEDDAGWTPNY